MTFVSSGFSFILHLAHHLASLSSPFANIPLLNQYFNSQPIAGVICKLRLVSLVEIEIWHVIDIDKK